MSEASIEARAQEARVNIVDTSAIPGWGVDADPKNDPTYPYRDRSKDEGLAVNWTRPSQQQSEVEVLQSVEYRHVPAVFGTSTPPSGISGILRRQAFRWSESNWLHWLILMGSDRINVIEGLVQDLGRAKIPNIPAEMGARAEWKHNKKGFVTKVVVVTGFIAGAIALVQARASRAAKRKRRGAAELGLSSGAGQG